uniref:Uncharacterized protein n=1 Tax=Oryzias sinensis TaxID=183150 RepID=A0A8C7WW86_9TELE
MNSEAGILLETVNFAADKHRTQRRKDPEETPYINHPIGAYDLGRGGGGGGGQKTLKGWHTKVEGH